MILLTDRVKNKDVHRRFGQKGRESLFYTVKYEYILTPKDAKRKYERQYLVILLQNCMGNRAGAAPESRSALFAVRSFSARGRQKNAATSFAFYTVLSVNRIMLL